MLAIEHVIGTSIMSILDTKFSLFICLLISPFLLFHLSLPNYFIPTKCKRDKIPTSRHLKVQWRRRLLLNPRRLKRHDNCQKGFRVFGEHSNKGAFSKRRLASKAFRRKGFVLRISRSWLVFVRKKKTHGEHIRL